MATLYFNSTASGNADYSRLDNWWLNVGATVPAGVLPIATDNIIVQTGIDQDSTNLGYTVGVNLATFNNGTYLNTDLSVNTATFNGNSTIGSSGTIDNSGGQLGNAVFNNTACNAGGVIYGTAKFNYLTATINGGIYQITDITGYGVGYAVGGAYDSANHLIGIVNFVNTDFQSVGYMTTYQGTSSDVTINFYNSTANYGNIYGIATFHDYSQNFGNLDGYPIVVYPNPNIVVGGTYNTYTNKGAGYIGYGVYFSDFGNGGAGDGDWNKYVNWFGNDGISGNTIPTAANDDQVSFFDCWPTQDTSGAASLLVLTLYGPTQFAISIAMFGDTNFYNTSFFAVTGSTGGNSEYINFYNSSYNLGTLTNGDIGFYNNSYNAGTVSYSGAGYEISLTFHDDSYNSGIVTGTSAFYGNTYNSGYVGTSGGTTASFHDASQNRGVIGGTLTTGSLAYWNLNDDGSGGVSLVDSTGNGYTLTNQDGVTLGSGIIGGGAVFTDAIGDQSLYNNSVLGVGNGAASTSFWINPTTYGTGGFSDYAGAPFSYNYDTSSGWLFIFNTDGNLRLFNGNLAYQSIAVIPLNAWTHICVTRDESSNVNFYINGSLDGSFTESSYINTTYSIFGRPIDQSSGVLHYNGIVDETGIWNRALSQTEVTALYNGGAGRTYPFTGSTPSAISNGDFNDTSINIGLITGSARFRYVTATSGVVVDVTGYANGPVNGLTYDSANNVITTWRFQGTHFMLSGATITGNAQFVQNTGASGIPVCLITGNAVVTSPAQRPLQATVLGSITYVGYGGSSSVNIFVMLNFPFPINYILGKTNPFGISALLKLPFYINK